MSEVYEKIWETCKPRGEIKHRYWCFADTPNIARTINRIYIDKTIVITFFPSKIGEGLGANCMCRKLITWRAGLCLPFVTAVIMDRFVHSLYNSSRKCLLQEKMHKFPITHPFSISCVDIFISAIILMKERSILDIIIRNIFSFCQRNL